MLQHLDLSGITTVYGASTSLQILKNTEGIPNLRRLILNSLPKLQSLNSLGSLPELEYLSVSGCTKLLSIVGFANQGWSLATQVPRLKELNLSGCTKLQSLSGVEGLQALEIVNIQKCKVISDLSPLHELSQLKQVIISKLAFGAEQLEALKTVLPQLEILQR